MQYLSILITVFMTAAVIGVLLWRIKPQSTAGSEAAERRIAEEAEKARTLQAKLDVGETNLRNAAAAVATAKATMDAADARATVAERNAERANTDLAALRRKYQDVEPQVATATEQKKAAEAARADVAQRLAELTTRYASLQADTAQKLERATKAEKDAAAATAEAEAVKRRAEASDTRLSEAILKLDNLHVDLSGMKSSLAEAVAQRDAAEAAKTDAGQRLASLVVKHDALTAEHKSAVAQAATAENEAANTHTRNGEILGAYEIIVRELDAAKREIVEAAAKQQSGEDSTRHFENISQSVLKEVLEEAKRGVAELAASIQKSGGDELTKHAESVARTLEPLQAKLQSYDAAVDDFQKGSQENYGSLKEQLSKLQETERSLHDQAKALTTALSSTPKYKGTYGEMALERLMEHAGLQEGPHYEKQARRNTEDGLKIPDMVVKMPGNQKVVVDAKAVMDAYVAAQQTQDEAERSVFLKKHCENVRSRVVDLSSKNYFTNHDDAVELVVLFLPAENLYVAAMENDHGLADYALSRNVIVCGPSLLIMLLKSANQLWRRASIEEEALKIKECGDAIYEAACRFIERYATLGAKIDQLEKAYNEAAGTLNGNLIPKSRSMGRFASMAGSKEVEDISEFREGIRPFSSPEAKKILRTTTEKLPGLSLGEFETAELTFAAGDK